MLLTLGQIVLMCCASVVEAAMGARASNNLHRITLTRLLHAPSSWFEGMPSGQIMSRFSGDLSTSPTQRLRRRLWHF